MTGDPHPPRPVAQLTDLQEAIADLLTYQLGGPLEATYDALDLQPLASTARLAAHAALMVLLGYDRGEINGRDLARLSQATLARPGDDEGDEPPPWGDLPPAPGMEEGPG